MQIELAKSQNEEAFYDMADHAMWAFSQMSDYLELNKTPIKYIELDKCPNLTFQNQKVNTIPKNNGIFNYIFFKQGKAPYILQDPTMPEDEINKYFELKNPEEPAPAVPKLVSDCSVICQECGLLYTQSNDFEDNFKKQFKSNADYLDNYIAIISQRLVKIQVKLDSMGIANLSNSLTGPNVSDCPNLNFDGYILQAQPNLDTYILYKKGKKPHILKDLKNPNKEIEEYFSKD